MNKQTFPIPEGCKAITMEIIDNTIVTTFGPQFKRGDVFTCRKGHTCVFDRLNEINNGYFHEIVGVVNNTITQSDDFIFGSTEDYRLATPEEAQRLWDALAKEGKRWNPETMEVEEIKKEIPMAKLFEVYYFVESNSRRVIESSETKDRIDSERHRYGNYFLSKEQAQRAADKLKSALDEFWKEELK